MRTFTNSQKQTLFTDAKGVCSNCGIELPKNWHSDHIIPFSKGGETDVQNGQALCPKCNLRKSNSLFTLRPWQKAFYKLPYTYFSENNRRSFLLHAGVGSGKTIASIQAAIEFLKEGFNVVICSPSENVKNEWAKEFNKHGFDIDNKYTFRYNYKRDYKGISITYQALNPNNVEFLTSNNIIDAKTLIILDEVHHLGDVKSWGDSIQILGDYAGFVLLLTGTPTRSDNSKIPFATYEPLPENNKYKLKVDHSYTYADSVSDRICCPITFRAIEVKSDESKDGYLTDSTTHRKVLSSAINVSGNDWVKEVVGLADKQLDDLRERMPDAAGLVVCNSIEDAKRLGDMMPNATVITSDENNSDDIDRFSKSDDKWVISVRMISEGVNIPRIRVIVYATNYNTMLFFQQVAGRGVRNRNDEERGTIDHCYFYYPNYEPLVNNAKTIEDQISHIVERQQIEFNEKLTSEEYNSAQTRLDFDLYDVSMGGEIVINAGQDMTWLHKYKSQVPDSVLISMERDFAEQLRSGAPKPTNMMKADRIKEIKNKIHKVVGQIKFNSKLGYEEIHYLLNKQIGVTTTSELHDETRLAAKYAYSLQLLETVKNGSSRQNN